MENNPVKYGIDRCPATKNLTQAAFCRQCDFRRHEQHDCCECTYFNFIKKANERKEYHRVH
ncbi:MAG: hypothetical protein RO469_06455 [Thermincola sp.]|nr:hypothetical protein [Thermincola sp.]MDT3704433.1 hypothetical protein [Thermincola sp.]